MPASSHAPAVAVLGARGFVGGALRRRLEQQGRAVVAVGRGELRDPDALRQVAAARTVVWAATSVNPAIASENPELIARDRADFVEFLDLLERARTDARVVFMSSGGAIYGAEGAPFRETSPARPISAYGAAKLDLEQLLRSRRSGTVSLRVSNVYGPGQNSSPGQGVINHWLRSVRAGTPIQVFGGLDTQRDYLYIDDLVAALVAVDEARDPLPEIINLGSGKPSSLAEVLEIVEAVTEDSDPRIERMPQRSFDLSVAWLDCRLAARDLGWHASTPLRDGVARQWEWLQRHGD